MEGFYVELGRLKTILAKLKDRMATREGGE
jgi:hypothetical protein